MKILMTISSLNRNAGGPSKSVTELSAGLANRGIPLAVISIDTGEELVISPSNVAFKISLHKSKKSALSRYSARLRLAEELKLESSLRDDLIIHNHGIWLGVNHVATRVARDRRIPLIVSTRGMLEPWALNHKKYKKQLSWHLYQKRDLGASMVLHATAPKEAENLRCLGIKKPIAIIPNGVDVPNIKLDVKDVNRRKTILFLSRIHPVKGLLNLVGAWKLAQPKGWRVVIAGPDENGHQKVVEEAVKSSQLEDQFEFVGPIYGEKKWELFSSSDIFVLPSFSENFGIVVAEALASGLPVITTKSTPWKELVTHKCGWWVDTGVVPLVEALLHATSLSDQELLAMGRNGRTLVEKLYSWTKISSDMYTVYEWMLKGGGRPDCVFI